MIIVIIIHQSQMVNLEINHSYCYGTADHLMFWMKHGGEELKDGNEGPAVNQDRVGLPSLVQWKSTRLLLGARGARC